MFNVHPNSLWLKEGIQYIARLYVPGVSNPLVKQEGRQVIVTGRNDTLSVEYNYTVSLHPKCTDSVQVEVVAGIVLLKCGDIDSLKTTLVPIGGCNPVSCLNK